MKKTIYLVLALVLTGTIFISSCQKDDPIVVPPSISFVAGADYVSADITMLTNHQFKVGINTNKDAESDNKLTNFKVVRTFNNIPFTVIDPEENGRRACLGLSGVEGYTIQSSLPVGLAQFG